MSDLSSASPSLPAISPSQTNITVTAPRGMGFRSFLSELNPLQYIPVVGTIYRALTGDTIPESVRLVGSIVVGGLTGGPIGAATTLAVTAVEKLSGIDPEKIGQTILGEIGIGAQTTGWPAVAIPHRKPTPGRFEKLLIEPRPVAWSPAQLTAYGVATTTDGTLRRGMLQGSDVLNDLELARIRPRLVA